MAFGIDDIIGVGLRIIDKIIPDPTQRDAAKLELLKQQQQGQLDELKALVGADASQNAVNQAEAQNSSLFVAGWRPYIGWVAGSALAIQYVVGPLVVWIGTLVGHPIAKPPSIDDALWQLITAILGIGGLRTYEKIKGVAK